MKKKPMLILFFFSPFLLLAQDLEGLLDEDGVKSSEKVEKIFRSTRIVNLHSIELPASGELIFNIGHRFDKITGGVYEMFGLDNATMRIGLDYGLFPWLGVGVGRSTLFKTYDAYVKPIFIRQGGFPVSVGLYSSISNARLKLVYPENKDNFRGRASFVNSLMLARKFHEYLSVQVNASWLHSNHLFETGKAADDVSLGGAIRVMLIPWVHLNLEYLHEVVSDGFDQDVPVFSIGFDVETGGHVFQLFFSNTQGINDKAVLINTTERFFKDKAIFFGFNITRVFYLGS